MEQPPTIFLGCGCILGYLAFPHTQYESAHAYPKRIVTLLQNTTDESATGKYRTPSDPM